MQLKVFMNILLKRVWIVILIPILAAAMTAVVSFCVLEPVYESSITLYVMNKNIDSRLAYDDFLASQQLINDCRELVKSKSITRAVIDQLDMADLNEADLAGKIIVNLKNDTRLLVLKVRDPSAERAMKIADTLGVILKDKVNALMKLEILDVVDEAEMPGKPVSPRPLVNTIIVFFGAMFLAVCTVFMIEYLDDTIKNSEDIEKLLGIKVIGIIPSFDLK